MKVEDLEEGTLIALLASAGCGKSYTLKQLSQTPRLIKACSTTGISAVNLADENFCATTVNSALGYFDTASLKAGILDKSVLSNLKKISRYFRFLAIDEISMLCAEDLDYLVYAISLVNQEKKSGSKLGLLVVGDIYQLSPVGSFQFNGITKSFGKPFFMAKCWPKFKCHYLTEVKRQTDVDFLTNLNLLKRGSASECVDWFLSNVEFDDYVDRKFEGSTIFSINKSVDQYNSKRLAELDTLSRSYTLQSEGRIGSIAQSIPDTVDLKIDCLVMLLSNNWQKGYANGDLAYVREFFEDKVKVELLRNGEEKIIESNKLENKDFSGKVHGSLRYMPLRVAFGVTSFKSQGLSLDRVQLKLTGDDLTFMSRLHGSLYTAISRCRTKEGLRIVGNRASFIKACRFDEVYKDFNY